MPTDDKSKSTTPDDLPALNPLMKDPPPWTDEELLTLKGDASIVYHLDRLLLNIQVTQSVDFDRWEVTLSPAFHTLVGRDTPYPTKLWTFSGPALSALAHEFKVPESVPTTELLKLVTLHLLGLLQ